LSRAFRVFIALVVIGAVLSAIGAAVGGIVSPAVGSLVVAVSLGILALVAIWDGASRLSGHQGLLGGTTRLGKALAILQIGLALFLLLSILAA
jgi:hypothetical protein